MPQSPVSNLQPTLTLAEYIDMYGVYPPHDGTSDGPFIGEIDISAAPHRYFGFLAEGQVESISQYETGFTVLGLSYGGNGVNNFDLPNLSGVEMVGSGQGKGLQDFTVGEEYGNVSNTILPANLPAGSPGSQGSSLNNYQPSLAITYAINVTGIFPGGTLSSGEIGVVTAFAGNFVPGGEMACDGQILQISQYSALYSVIGNAFGGNGVTTFALPDLQGRDIVGAGAADGTNYVLGQDVGSPGTFLQSTNLPSGGDQPIDIVQPGLALNYYIATSGVFPSSPVDQGSSTSGTPYLGQIFAFAGTLPDPTGCLLCAGQLLQVSQYGTLFSLLGTTYGGDGVTTFALPDLRGKSILGVGASNLEGQTQGATTATLTDANFAPPVVGPLTQTTTEAVQGGAGVFVLASTPTGMTASMTNGDPQSVSVSIATPQAGDLLGVNGNFALSSTATSFTTSNGGKFNATFNNDELTISNSAGTINNVAQFEAAMALVGYEDTGSDATTGRHTERLLNWLVDDGIQYSLGVQSSIIIDRAPVLSPETLTFQFPIGSATTSTTSQGVLSSQYASDLDGDKLTVVAVAGVAANVGVSVAGADGTLTLNANGSFSYLLTGLASRTDSFLYTVSDGEGGTATETLTFDVPTGVAPKISVATPADHTAKLTAPVKPFANDVVMDENGAAVIDTLTVTPSSPSNGVLSDPNSATDGSSVNPTTGVFSVSGDAAAVTGALDGLLYTPAANTVGHTTTFTIVDYSADSPNAASDSTTEVTDAPCYARGVRILTERGEVAVEDLRIGDLVVAASGARRPIRWIGHRKVDCRRHPQPALVWPYRVRAGAFGEGAPQRDLWLSPGHAVACEGALIPIRFLANGVSVAQVACAAVEYWHVELDAHDVIYAEGLPAESYLDTGNRMSFANSGGFVEAHPDFQPRHWADTCLPLAMAGPAVVATKAQLLARLAEANGGMSEEADAHIRVDGLRAAPIRLSPTRLAFALPSGGREIWLRSRTFTPAHTLAESDDPRTLGLCVAGLQIDGAAAPLSRDDALSGWWEPEYDGEAFTHRWTTGSTPLPAGARIVIVDLAGVGHYSSAPQDRLSALMA